MWIGTLRTVHSGMATCHHACVLPSSISTPQLKGQCNAMSRESVLKSDGAKALAEAGKAAMTHSNLSFCGMLHHGGNGPYNNERQLLCTMAEGIIEVGTCSC